MALARPMSYEIEIEVDGTAVRTKPIDNKGRQTSQREIRHTQGVPRPKVRVSPLLVGVLVLVWLGAVGLGLLLVQRWAEVANTGFEITRMREAMVQLQTEQQALEAESFRLQSLASIEERALQLGMQKPASVEQVGLDPTVVANKVEAPEATLLEVAPEMPVSLWDMVRQAMVNLWQQGRQMVGASTAPAQVSGQ